MSWEVSYEYTEIETVEVKINCINKKELEKLEKAITTSINQKLEKLNILIKNFDVYYHDDHLLINDRYNVCPSLLEIADAFGLSIKQIECSLKGKNYIITDKLIDVLKQLNNDFIMGKNIANKQISADVKNIINNNKLLKMQIDKELIDYVINVKQNGVFTTKKSREVRVVGDEYGEERKNGDWDLNESYIEKKLLKLAKDTQNTVNQTNINLRDGTAKLIHYRARQMGYSVQEIKKDNQIQLVLVRC